MYKNRNYFLSIYCLLNSLLFSSLIQSQGNYRLENYGNRSILLNGNVTGSVEDLGLTYYNPSRLAMLENPSFSITAKAYELSNINFNDALGSGENISSSSFRALPSMISGTFKIKSLPKDKFAYSFISKSRQNFNFTAKTGLLEGEFVNNIPGAEKFLGKSNLIDNIEDEWFGVTWARKVTDNFSIGISSFASLYKMAGEANTIYAAESNQNIVATYVNNLNFVQRNYSLFFKIGGSLEVKNLSLGVNFHLPNISLYNNASFNSEAFLSGLGSGQDFFNIKNFSDLQNSRKTPFGISFGGGLKLKKNTIHFNVEWFDGVKKYERISIPETLNNSNNTQVEFNEQLKSVLNFGLGLEFFISDRINFYGSFSSDFLADVESPNLFDVINQTNEIINYKSNYWHYSAGFDFDLKWGKFILGSVYSTTSSSFIQPINFPNNQNSLKQTSLSIKRWRFIIGVELPLFQLLSKKIKSEIQIK